MFATLIKKIKNVPFHIWLLLAIFIGGIFFRVYNHNDWLLFKGDAYRDAILVSHAVDDGPLSLPLLGPRASGTDLHLGPIFYYFQYLSGTIFDSTEPYVYAYPDLLFSILIIPLVYLFFKCYFSVWISTILTGLVSFSFISIETGRFAWNPNSIPFFALLFFYALLKMYNTEKKNIGWFAVAGGALAIATQLHFVTFVGLPLVFAIFMAINWRDFRRIFSWKSFLVFVGAILFFYIPVIVNDIFYHGYNLQQLIKATGNRGEILSLFWNIVQNAKMFSKFFLDIIAGMINSELWQRIISGVFFLAATIINIWFIYKEKNKNKKFFLQLSLIFVSVYFLMYIPLAYDINRTRFFLPLFILPFVFFGYVIMFLQKIKPTIFKLVFAVLAVFLLLNNIKTTVLWFSNISISQNGTNSQTKNFKWVWWHFENIAQYINNNCDKKEAMFLMSKNVKEYAGSVSYALIQENESLQIDAKTRYQKKTEDLDRCYFFVSLAKDEIPDFVQQAVQDAPFYFANARVIKWHPENAVMPIVFKNDYSKLTLQEKISNHSRLSWGDLLN